jgi:hypothetical protein
MGELVSRTTRLWEALCTTARVLYHGSSSFQVGSAAYCCLQCHMLRPVFSNMVINNVTAAISSANEWYMRRATVYLFIMFCKYIFSCCFFPFIMTHSPFIVDIGSTLI